MYQKNQGRKKLLLHAIIFVFFLPIETSAQRKKDRNKKGEAITNTIKKSKAILYANFVNEGTKPDEDLFKVHEHKENHYAAIDMVGDLRKGIYLKQGVLRMLIFIEETFKNLLPTDCLV